MNAVAASAVARRSDLVPNIVALPCRTAPRSRCIVDPLGAIASAFGGTARSGGDVWQQTSRLVPALTLGTWLVGSSFRSRVDQSRAPGINAAPPPARGVFFC